MVMQNIKVTQSFEGKVSELTISDKGRVVVLQCLYGSDGMLNAIEAIKGRLSKTELIEIARQFVVASTPKVNISNILGIDQTPLNGRVVSMPLNHTEWWEWMTNIRINRSFFYNMYTGRSFPLSPVYVNEVGSDPENWHIPPVIIGDTPAGIPPWSLDMTNRIGGESAAGDVTQIYVEPRATYKPPAMAHAIIRAPDIATLPAGTSLLFGFECNGQGGTTIYAIYWEAAAMTLKTR